MLYIYNSFFCQKIVALDKCRWNYDPRCVKMTFGKSRRNASQQLLMISILNVLQWIYLLWSQVKTALCTCSISVRVLSRQRRPAHRLLLVSELSPGRGNVVVGSRTAKEDVDQSYAVYRLDRLVDSPDGSDGQRRTHDHTTSATRVVQVLAENRTTYCPYRSSENF